VSERLTILVIVGTRTDAHSLGSQVGMRSESDCLLGQFESGEIRRNQDVLQKQEVSVEMTWCGCYQGTDKEV